MATASDRGWVINPATVRVPCSGIPLNLHPTVAPVFAELIRQVEAIKGRGFMVSAGGKNVRPVRGYEKKYASTKDPELLSEHSWALAADFRAATNPQRAHGPTDMPRNIEAICRSISPHLVWGGAWSGSRRDPMHFEYVGTPADAARDVARLKNRQEDELTPEDRALLIEVRDRLRHLDNELLGPEGVRSRIDGKRMPVRTMLEAIDEHVWVTRKNTTPEA